MDRIRIRPMKPADFADVTRLWKKTEGIGLTISDTRTNLSRYLGRNPGLSLVALSGPEVVAAVICGHDGRRGSLGHLAVAKEFRRKNIASRLVELCLKRLKRLRIPKCNIFVYKSNSAGLKFWEAEGWKQRKDLLLFQKETRPGNARR